LLKQQDIPQASPPNSKGSGQPHTILIVAPMLIIIS